MESNTISESLLNNASNRAATLIDRLARLTRVRDRSSGLVPAQWEALRYLATANRFSRTPAALADYLQTTRGTISQTLIALEQKGLVQKKAHLNDGRSITLVLTPQGKSLLNADALEILACDIAESGEAEQLTELLENVLRTALTRRGGRAFGACRGCRFFRQSQLGPEPYRCGLLDEPLSESDANAICIEYA